MVCYELFCLARPYLGYPQYFDIIKASALTVLNRGGVLMDIKSFDQRLLAYPINRSGTRIEEVRHFSLSLFVFRGSVTKRWI